MAVVPVAARVWPRWRHPVERDQNSDVAAKGGPDGGGRHHPDPPTIPAQGPVVFAAPPGGWSREAYSEAIRTFTRARGRAPQTITMHPHTLGAVTRLVVRREAETVVDRVRTVVHREEQVREEALDQGLEQAQHATNIVTSDAHDRATIVMT